MQDGGAVPNTADGNPSASTASGSRLSIRGLTVQFAMPMGIVRAVDNVSLDIAQGETVGVVGESGSGKSVTFLSVMGMVRQPGRIVAGSVELDGRDLSKLGREELRGIRGRDISMVFQDPQTSLNPVFPIGKQIVDVFRAHLPISKDEARRRALEVLDLVHIPEAKNRFDSFPHEFSGGMRQRVLIAMALALRPRFIIADEPTTALDVTMQAQILELLHELKQEINIGLVLITHDLGVVARSADRVVVMYGGKIVEQGDVRTIFYEPRHPYTVSLMRSMPRIDMVRGERLHSIGGSPPSLSGLPAGCAFHPRCFLGAERPQCRTETPELHDAGRGGHRSACHYANELELVSTDAPKVGEVVARAGAQTTGEALLEVRDLRMHYPAASFQVPWNRKVVKAVDGVSFSVREGETLGIVGESGCGKSTLGRCLIRLIEPTSGSIAFRGSEISHLGVRDMRALRTDIQMVFQDPYASLDPRMTVESILREPFEAHGQADVRTTHKIKELMAHVGLNPEHIERRPHEFSGGQRQRIGIARALALKPKLIILDEPVSALDVSVQAQIINLLKDLQAEFKLTYLFIAHDLSVVRHICDRVMVMYLGRIIEAGDRDTLFADPRHPYTKVLLSAVPLPDPDKERARAHVVVPGSVPSPINPPRGCHFHPRCPSAAALAGSMPADELEQLADGGVLPKPCVNAYPDIGAEADGHVQACHFVGVDNQNTGTRGR